MNLLLKKEIRLLLPVWLAVLVLEVVPPWIGSDPNVTMGLAPVIFFFGMILLAVDPFGREFSLGTFSSLMSQPMERRQIWQTKITVLVLGAALIFAAYFASCELRLHLTWSGNRAVEWHANQFKDFRLIMFASVACLFVALVGGLWTALLLRQITTAFWITFLAPAGILATAGLCLPAKYADNDRVLLQLFSVLGVLYTVAGFWLARRLFHRAQDVGWIGTVISFSMWRYFSARARQDASTRRRQPLTALLKKEFQLHSASLLCAGLLLVLHLAIFVLRITYVKFHRLTVVEACSDLFWVLWLLMPLIIGGTAVAEERKLGLTESQFCLPVSRRTQFVIKFISVMFFGTLLGGAMPLLLETLAAWFNAPSDTFSPVHYGQFGGPNLIEFEVWVVAVAAGLSGISFFASTLARNFLQAMSITVVAIAGGCLAVPLLKDVIVQPRLMLGILPWPSLLPMLLGVPTLLATLVWLMYRNFNWFHEDWRLWRRNLVGIMMAILFVFVSSALLYNRVWEVFEPAEPAHGPAIFSLAHPSALQDNNFGSLLVRLPDGRVSFDSLSYSFITENQSHRWKQLWWILMDPRPASAGPWQFIGGSNWVSATAVRVDPSWNSMVLGGSGRADGYLDTVGIQANGTLWISSRAAPKVWTGGEMTQFGNETNWLQVTRNTVGSCLLLKQDGTLWRWGTNHWDWNQWPTNWPTVRNSPPRQIGTNSDWNEILNGWLARKTDGSVWGVGLVYDTGQDEVERQTNLNQIHPRSFSYQNGNLAACVDADGALWVSDRHAREDGMSWEGAGFLRVGQDTNWVAVSMSSPALVALKADGSLWQWNPAKKSTAEYSKTPPARLGIHNDWVALTDAGSGAITLAADGSLWWWPHGYAQPFMKLPKQPKFLGNVFTGSKSRQPEGLKTESHGEFLAAGDILRIK